MCKYKELMLDIFSRQIGEQPGGDPIVEFYEEPIGHYCRLYKKYNADCSKCKYDK